MTSNSKIDLIADGHRREDLHDAFPVGTGKFGVSWSRLNGGVSDGVDTLKISTGAMETTILPTRGMAIWKIRCFDPLDENATWELGWQSPVHGPVHPRFVPLTDASGVGWLEGFDELFVRCGLISNGAPEFSPGSGGLRYGLHGRVANLPASELKVEIDPMASTCDVFASIYETRFLLHSLRLDVHLRFRANNAMVEVTDRVTNMLNMPCDMQMLYHTNIGQPILEAGSKIYARLQEIAPKDEHSAEQIDHWNEVDGPTVGYRERVYFAKAANAKEHWSHSVLTNAGHSRGVGIQYDARTLPYLNIWKNSASVDAGYVVGIEPATGFPNTKSFEQSQGRTVKLAGGESKTFRLQLAALRSESEVRSAIEAANEGKKQALNVANSPKSGWSSF